MEYFSFLIKIIFFITFWDGFKKNFNIALKMIGNAQKWPGTQI